MQSLDHVADVLDRLLIEPSDALRAERRAIVRDVLRRPEPAVRRLLAEHYRALGIPSQAGRWGVADADWATTAEVRALRLELLGQHPSQPTREHLGLAHDDTLPEAVADLERRAIPRARPHEVVAGSLVVVAVLALAAGVLLLLLAGGLALLSIGQPGWLWPAIAVCGGSVLGSVAATVGAFAVGDRVEARLARRDPHARELARLLPRLVDPAERRSLAIAAMRSTDAETRSTARRILVEASRALGREDDVARWGAALEGVTTAEEREALARRLAGASDPVRRFAVRSHRLPGVLGIDERDVLLRAGVPAGSLDAFDAQQPVPRAD